MRQDWVLRGFRQFEAPVSMVLTYDREANGDFVRYVGFAD